MKSFCQPNTFPGTKERNPSPDEVNTFMALFAGGRYMEAANLAQTMTVRFPLHVFGWKALGVVLAQMGRSEEALAPMQKAAALSRDDVDAHNNLGVVLQNLGRLNEAETSYRRALEIKPDSPEAYGNLGNTLRELGRLGEAESSLRRALVIKPACAGTYNSLANTLADLGRKDEAEINYRRALELMPDYAEAHNNLGAVLMDLGRLYEAEASYRRAVALKPDFAGALCNLGHTLCYLDDLGQAAVAYQKAVDLDPVNTGLDAGVYLAILWYLDGNYEQCRSRLVASQRILENNDFRHRNFRIYWSYLDKILSWYTRSNSVKQSSKAMDPLYIVGESHSLAAHGVVVRYQGEERLCVAKWIPGCTQWHLGNSKANKYKHKFEVVMARLPRNSVILLSIGEIDCRYDEGIMKAWKKFPNETLAEVATNTVKAYVEYVEGIAKRYEHKIIISGVPCSNLSLDALTPIMVTQFVRLIYIVNATLKNFALASGIDFLDVYALTDRGDGVANGEWHIDSFHLLPNAVMEAFNKHYLPSK